MRRAPFPRHHLGKEQFIDELDDAQPGHGLVEQDGVAAVKGGDFLVLSAEGAPMVVPSVVDGDDARVHGQDIAPELLQSLIGCPAADAHVHEREFILRALRPEVLGDEPIIDAKLCAGAAHEDQRRVLPRVSSDAVGVVVGDPEQILVRLIEPLHRHGVGVAELDLCGVELKFKMDQPQGELRCPCGQQQTQQGSQ